MTPEKEPGLIVETSPESDQTQRVVLDPTFFSRSALKQIARSQIYSQEPRNLTIIKSDSVLSISHVSLLHARNYFGEKRVDYLNFLASEMKGARKIILSRHS